MMDIERPTVSNPIEEEEQLMNRAENFTESEIAMDPTILDEWQTQPTRDEDSEDLPEDDDEFERTGSVDPLSEGQE